MSEEYDEPKFYAFIPLEDYASDGPELMRRLIDDTAMGHKDHGAVIHRVTVQDDGVWVESWDIPHPKAPPYVGVYKAPPPQDSER